MHRSSQFATVSAGVAAAVVLSVVPATATPPRAGATYRGHLASAPSSDGVVAFAVSKDGRWVRGMRLGSYPFTRCGSGGTPPFRTANPAQIKRGTFTAHVLYSGEGKVIARVTVTGRFLRGGKEKGVVTAHIVGSPTCDDSLHYTTHAQ